MVAEVHHHGSSRPTTRSENEYREDLVLRVMRKNEPKQLLDRIADTPRRGFALGLGVLPVVARQPIFHEGFNMGGEFLPLACLSALSKLCESEQGRHTYKKHAFEAVCRNFIRPA